MKIALDYDGTVTEDLELWAWFVKMARGRGHDIRVVTFRGTHELTSDLLNFQLMTEDEKGWKIPIHFTNHIFKQKYLNEGHSWDPDVWIDDAPALIDHNDKPWSEEKLNEWAKTLPNRVVEEPGSAKDGVVPEAGTPVVGDIR